MKSTEIVMKFDSFMDIHGMVFSHEWMGNI